MLKPTSEIFRLDCDSIYNSPFPQVLFLGVPLLLRVSITRRWGKTYVAVRRVGLFAHTPLPYVRDAGYPLLSLTRQHDFFTETRPLQMIILIQELPRSLLWGNSFNKHYKPSGYPEEKVIFVVKRNINATFCVYFVVMVHTEKTEL